MSTYLVILSKYLKLATVFVGRFGDKNVAIDNTILDITIV